MLPATRNRKGNLPGRESAYADATVPPEGISYVIVDGTVVVDGGELVDGARPGDPVRAPRADQR